MHMKYMGSKRAMLRNGLGELLDQELVGAKRFVDLFAGSAAVSAHVASKFVIPVIASDLQTYSVVLASAVIRQRGRLSADQLWKSWYERAIAEAKKPGGVPSLPRRGLTIAVVEKHREWSSKQFHLPLTAAYGG